MKFNRFFVITISIIVVIVTVFLINISDSENQWMFDLSSYTNFSETENNTEEFVEKTFEDFEIPEENMNNLTSLEKQQLWEAIDSYREVQRKEELVDQRLESDKDSVREEIIEQTEEYDEENAQSMQTEELKDVYKENISIDISNENLLEDFFSKTNTSMVDLQTMNPDEFAKAVDENIDEWEEEKQEIKRQEQIRETILESDDPTFVEKNEEIVEEVWWICDDVSNVSGFGRCVANSWKDVDGIEEILPEDEYNDFKESYYKTEYFNNPSLIFEEPDSWLQEDSWYVSIEQLIERWVLDESNCNRIEFEDGEEYCYSLF